MTIEEAIADLTAKIQAASPNAVIRVNRSGPTEATIRAYAPEAELEAITRATQGITLQLLISDGLDIQVSPYDIAISVVDG